MKDIVALASLATSRSASKVILSASKAMLPGVKRETIRSQKQNRQKSIALDVSSTCNDLFRIHSIRYAIRSSSPQLILCFFFPFLSLSFPFLLFPLFLFSSSPSFFSRKIRLVVSRKRRFFNAPVQLGDAVYAADHDYPPASQFMAQQPADDEEAPPPQLTRALMDNATQAVPETTSSSMQTTW